MTIIQPHRVNLSIASPSEIERTAQQLRAIREDFLGKGILQSWTPRPLILDSWERCRTLQVNPSRRCAPLAVARDAQLDQLRALNALLMQAAQPVMNHLIDFLADSGYVVVLSDTQGRLLDVIGDNAIRRRLARIDFIPGGNWSEAAAGTNAIGTALADGHVVQLMAAEHYCDGWQDLTCTASPIRHPITNEIIGILDVTGNYRLIRPFLTSFLAESALEIKQRLHTLIAPPSYADWARNARTFSVNPFVTPKIIETNKAAQPELSIEPPPGSIPGAFPPDPLGVRRYTFRTGGRQEFTAFLDPLEGTETMVDIQWLLNLQERRAHDAERLVTATGIISASLDLDVTIEKVAEQVVHLLHVERAGVSLFNEEEEIASIYVHSVTFPSRPEQPDTLVALLKESRALALIRERGEPVVIDDILASSLMPAAFGEQIGMRALMLLPLVTARGVSGFIAASRSSPDAWTVEDIRLGIAIATQSATAIENACLFDALQKHNRQIETLNAIARIFDTLPDPDQHLDLVLQRITEIINVDAGMILLLDETSDLLTVAAPHTLARHIQIDATTRPWNALHALAHRVVSQRESVMVRLDDCADPLLFQALRLLGFYNLTAVPLATSDAILGILLVSNTGRDDSIRDDLKFFSTIGQQLGLALRNAQLRRAASEMAVLREADRLKSNFLGAVSHDLRSPLTAIRASVESLLDVDGVQSASGREHLLHNIAGQAGRLGQLVDQLLDLSKIEAGALPLDCDWVELPALLADAINEFEHLHAGCYVERVLEPGLPLHYLDPDRLVQALWNLLENAYKYSPPASPLQVEARLLNNEVLISVADRGPGIPKSEHERIFQRFYRLDREHRTHTQGSGLGLAICKGIVEAHGGRIWVEERDGGGCIFLISLMLPAPGPVGFEVAEEQELLI